MQVQTVRFGTIEIAENRVIDFPAGLLGFSQQHRYVLLEPGEDSSFFWLQSIENPALAFVVTDPKIFVPDYAVSLGSTQMQELGITDLQQGQVCAIVNKVDGQLTANLQGPLVINTENRRGMQIVLPDKKWSVRHLLGVCAGRPAR